jgi:hypothetical protein
LGISLFLRAKIKQEVFFFVLKVSHSLFSLLGRPKYLLNLLDLFKVNVNEWILVKVRGQEQPKDAFELVHRNTVQVYRLHKVTDNIGVEDKSRLSAKQYLVNYLKDNVLHGWEVEGLDRELGTVLNVDAQVDFIAVVVLHSEHEAQVAAISCPVLLDQVDQIVKHLVVERLDVLDDENYRVSDLFVAEVEQRLHSVEGLLVQRVILVLPRMPSCCLRVFTLEFWSVWLFLLFFLIACWFVSMMTFSWKIFATGIYSGYAAFISTSSSAWTLSCSFIGISERAPR